MRTFLIELCYFCQHIALIDSSTFFQMLMKLESTDKVSFCFQ